MSNIGIKALVIGLLLFGLVGIVGYEVVTNEQIRSLPIKSASLPIKYVRTEGVFQYLAKDEVKAVLEPLVLTGFFDADMQAIHLAVSTLPWVDSVTVKRIWPDAIDIKVHERKPYARWGKDSLITGQGVIFTPKNIDGFQNLTVVTGPELQQVKILEIMKGIKTALADQSMELVEFSVNNRGAWKIKLATGLEILLGRNEQLKKLQRFLKTLTVLKKEQVEQIAIVDLRYPNGYAVSWKPGTAEIDWHAMQPTPQ
ncbi:cell division protein FtsQ/DivIB [Methylobacter psychrophilus]|uniref:cell division protein FtsQ/DivIB n=1 Tax=Methylobacter psychrophilus TaxID=96941 RepID=UPI0021D50D9D|nr:cell division protein FtsQ/DivIB [Methylobacter psychrophilus]